MLIDLEFLILSLCIFDFISYLFYFTVYYSKIEYRIVFRFISFENQDMIYRGRSLLGFYMSESEIEFQLLFMNFTILDWKYYLEKIYKRRKI